MTAGVLRQMRRAAARALSVGGALAGAAIIVTSSPARASGCELTQRLGESGPLKPGAPLPTFGGWTPDNALFSSKAFLAQHPGRALVLSFFATWCEPCKRGLPVLQALQRDHGDKVAVVLVAFAQDAAEVRPFLAQHAITLPVVLDTFEKQAKAFGVDSTLPRTFVAAPDGSISAIIGCEGADFGDAVLRAAASSSRAVVLPLKP